MADLTIQKIVEAGLNPTLGAASGGGDAILNLAGDVFLYVKNADATAKQITVTAQKTSKDVESYGSMTKANAVVSVPAGEIRLIGPFPRAAFNDAANKVQITYDAVTSLTVAAIQLPKAS